MRFFDFLKKLFLRKQCHEPADYSKEEWDKIKEELTGSIRIHPFYETMVGEPSQGNGFQPSFLSKDPLKVMIFALLFLSFLFFFFALLSERRVAVYRTVETVVPEVSMSETQDLRLERILSEEKKLAVLNGELVQTGSEIKGYRVVAIKKGAVTLEKDKERITLFL